MGSPVPPKHTRTVGEAGWEIISAPFPCSDLGLFAFSRRGRLSKQWMLGLCPAPARTVAGGLRSRTPRMRLLFPALVLALLATTRAAEGEL